VAITLFVYGTLKRGYPNHRRLMQAGCRYLGTAATTKSFSLWAAQVPYLVREEIASTPIQGELYEVEANQLPYLDNFEGHPNWYRRETITVHDATGKAMQAEAYVFIARLPPGSVRLDGGDYPIAKAVAPAPTFCGETD
jgi:gamma-glutamylaminecyclotransferase